MTNTPSPDNKETQNQPQAKATGKYVFDKKTGKVIKISDEIPSCSKPSAQNGCPHYGHTCSGGCSH